MSSKKESILESALVLFSKKGFDAVSTSQIAREANVSEGLIFRHFQNKQGLLDAIMELGLERIEPLMEEVASIDSPKQRIQTIMELPFTIDEEHYPLWRLIYALKWQREYYDEEMSKPMKELLTASFDELGYERSALQADLVMAYMDGFATTILLKRDKINKEELLKTLRKNYTK